MEALSGWLLWDSSRCTQNARRPRADECLQAVLGQESVFKKKKKKEVSVGISALQSAAGIIKRQRTGLDHLRKAVFSGVCVSPHSSSLSAEVWLLSYHFSRWRSRRAVGSWLPLFPRNIDPFLVIRIHIFLYTLHV